MTIPQPTAHGLQPDLDLVITGLGLVLPCGDGLEGGILQLHPHRQGPRHRRLGIGGAQHQPEFAPAPEQGDFLLELQLQRTDLLSRSLRFHIEGQIVYENMDEEIKFDTTLELISGEYEVK